jgi:2-hydroxycyclohexanecarboxyl-CoA dehydrogenase
MSAWAGRRVLITGGAHGIGKATAAAFLAEGARVAVWALNPGSVAEVKLALGGDLVAETVDVGDPEVVEAAWERLDTRWGGVDILVNNAGFTHTSPFLTESRAYWERVVATNWWGVITTVRMALPGMIAREDGAIVNVVSDAGRVGMAGEAVYAGAKGAVIAFSKSIAQEVARHQVRINCVSPGPTRTRILADNTDDAGPLLEKMIRRIPLRRIAEPEDVANAILFLAGPGARMITGQVLSVSGGLTMV